MNIFAIITEILALAAKYGPWGMGLIQALVNGYNGQHGVAALLAYLAANPLPANAPTVEKERLATLTTALAGHHDNLKARA